MDKVHNISLGGFAFSIEDKAYSKLINYLNSIENALKSTEDSQEIIKDIEYRIAELFKNRLRNREVVNLEDVIYVTEIMGNPSDYIQDDYDINDSTYSDETKSRRTLYRDPNDKMIGGVLSGLSYYLGIDVKTLRVIVALLPFLDFLFLGISTSTIFFIYILLWIVVPEAKTTAQILEMQGKPVNLDSIKNFVNEKSPYVKEKANEFSNSAHQFANKNKNSIENILKVIAKVLLSLIVIVGLIVAISLFFAFLVTSIGISSVGVSLSSLTSYIFTYSWQPILAFFSLTFFLLIPIVVLILLFVRILSPRYKTNKYIYLTLLTLFILSIGSLIYLSINVGLNFTNEIVVNKITTINDVKSSLTIKGINNIERSKNDYSIKVLNEDLFVFEDKLWNNQDIILYVEPSISNETFIDTEITAFGSNLLEAEQNANKISHTIQTIDNQVLLPSFYTLEQGAKFRGQEIAYTLHIPNNVEFNIENIDRLYVLKNGEYDRQYYAEDEKFKFVDNEFQCINCEQQDDFVQEFDNAVQDSVQ